MKHLLLIATLCAPLACQAAEPDAAPSPQPTAIKLPKGRCPTMPAPQMPAVPATGEFHLVAHFLLKADGNIENIRVEGRGPRGLDRNVAQAISGYRCLPADADQEIVQTFDVKVS